jgi:hypothetical protein
MMNWKGFGRKRQWLNRGNISAFGVPNENHDEPQDSSAEYESIALLPQTHR